MAEAAFPELSRKLLEARGGIEPPNKGFADLCLTTWLPRQSYSIDSVRAAQSQTSPASRNRAQKVKEIAASLPLEAAQTKGCGGWGFRGSEEMRAGKAEWRRNPT